MTDAVDISAEAIGRSIAELMGWLTGPDSGQNDGLITAANQLAALAKERDVAVRAYNDAQSHADHWALERDAARADALAAASREQEARAEAGRLREALQTIHESHVPDQPAAGGLSREDWAYSHVGKLRAIAGRALYPNGMKATTA